MGIRLMMYSDTGAPDAISTAGAIETLWDAVLVNGYNSLTLTSITRSGTTATATYTSHGYRDGATIRIAGANETEYNGDFVITNITANTFDYTVSGSPSTPATGTITAKVAPLDWTKTYDGTNKAVYRPGAGTQFYYRLDNTGGSTAIYVRGYETMSDVDTGTGPFPTVAQKTSGQLMYISTGANRTWYAAGDEKTFIFFLEQNNVAEGSVGTLGRYVFGDFTSYKSGDAYNAVCGGVNTVGGSTDPSSVQCVNYPTYSNYYAVMCARSYTQTGGSINLHPIANQSFAGGASTVYYPGDSTACLAYPNAPDGAFYMGRYLLGEVGTNSIRGHYRGLWWPGHRYTNFNHLDTFSGTGTLSGRKFMIFMHYSGFSILETSSTWD